MTDLLGIIIWLGSGLLKRLVLAYAFVRSSMIAIKEKKWGDYTYSLGIGNDIFGNKLIAPYANKYWVKSGGRKFGGNETISLCMAFNKRDGYNTPEADWWERRINFFQKNHLQITLDKYYSELSKQN